MTRAEAIDAATRARIPLSVLVRLPGGEAITIDRAEIERRGDLLRIVTTDRVLVTSIRFVAALMRPGGRAWWPRPDHVRWQRCPLREEAAMNDLTNSALRARLLGPREET